jgi:hypothetical protein
MTDENGAAAGDPAEPNPEDSVERGKPPAPPPAVPEPSKASQGRPVPKPIGARPPQPVEPTRPGSGATGGFITGQVGEPTDKSASSAGTTRDRLGSGPVPGKGRAAPKKPPSTHRVSPAPGMTQALRVGPGDEMRTKNEATTHALRKQDRINVREDVLVEYDFRVPGTGDGQRAVFNGRLVDISLGGLQIEGEVPSDLNPKDLASGPLIVHVRVSMTSVTATLEADARVTWTKPVAEGVYAMGLRFADEGRDQRNAIRAFLISLQSPTRTKFRRGR